MESTNIKIEYSDLPLLFRVEISLKIFIAKTIVRFLLFLLKPFKKKIT